MVRGGLKIFLFLAGLLCILGAAQAEQPTPESEIYLWHSWMGDDRKKLEEAVQQFNTRENNGSVSLKQVGVVKGVLAERILMSSAGQRMPDLLLIERDAIPLLADAERIRSIDALISSSETLHKGNLLEAAVAYATYDGRLFGLPVAVNPYVLFYDDLALTAAGVSSLPHDWPNFIELAEFLSRHALAKGQGRKWGLSVDSVSDFFYLLCAQRGVDTFDRELEADEAGSLLDILNFIRDLRQPPSLLPPTYKPWDPRQKGFSNGRAFFELGEARKFANYFNDRMLLPSVTVVPSDSAESCTYLSHSSVFVVCASSDKYDEVMKFLEFFYSPAAYSRFARRNLYVSPLESAIPHLENVAPDSHAYSALIAAARHATIHPLTARTGLLEPRISRIVEQMDAGLMTPHTARIRIQETISEQVSARPASMHLPVRVQWTSSTRRLFAGSTAGLHALPVEVLSGQQEHETFQLVVSSSEVIDDLEMSSDPLVAKDGRHLESIMNAYRQIDTEITKPLVASLEGPYPNVLEPLGSFSVEPNHNVRIWVDMFVTSDTPVGEYISHITLRKKRTGRIVTRIPINLCVLPLKIPASPSSPATIGLNYENIAEHYGIKKESERYKEVMDAFYWFMVDHRMSPYQPPVDIDADTLAEYLRDERVSVCRLGLHPLNPRFKAVVEVAKSGGWLEKMFAYTFDEPTYQQYPEIVEAGKYVHSLEAAPKFFVSAFPDKLLIGTVDIWGIHLRFLPQGIPADFLETADFFDAVRERLKAGDSVWWYTAGAIAPFPTLHIEDDPAAFRVIPWLQQFYRIDGFLHWEAANWKDIHSNPFVKFFGNGEGVLIYPGDMRPNPSIRLELLREGLEDMEYLMLLRRNIRDIQQKLNAEELGDAASVRVDEFCRRLIADEALRTHAVNNMLLIPHFIREPGHIECVREKLAYEAASLEERPYALVLTEPEEKQYTDADEMRIFGVVESDCEVEINGCGVAVDVSGEFSARFPLSSGHNIFSVELTKGTYRKLLRREILRF